MYCGKIGVYEYVCKWFNYNEFIEFYNIYNYIIFKKKKKEVKNMFVWERCFIIEIKIIFLM